jgi:hypothetical protein
MNIEPHCRYSWRRHAITLLLSLICTATSIGSVIALFSHASSGPWLPAELQALAAHCNAERSRAQRRTCLLEVAERRKEQRLAAQ